MSKERLDSIIKEGLEEAADPIIFTEDMKKKILSQTLGTKVSVKRRLRGIPSLISEFLNKTVDIPMPLAAAVGLALFIFVGASFIMPGSLQDKSIIGCSNVQITKASSVDIVAYKKGR